MRQKELTEIEKALIVAYHEEGRSFAWIGHKLSRSKYTIRDAYNRVKSRGTYTNEPRPGRPPLLSPVAERALKRSATGSREKRRIPLAEIGSNATPPVSKRTAQRTLKKFNMKRCLETQKIVLDEDKAAVRLKWCRAHVKWTVSDWQKVVWSDECSVSRYSDAGRLWVTRTSHERWSSECVMQKGGGARISSMFWGCFYAGTLGPIVPMDGSVTAANYLDIIQSTIPEVLDLMPGSPGEGIFMQDNATVHKAHIVLQWLDATGYTYIKDWPPYSPDLNPIEHVWRRLKQLFGQQHSALRHSTRGPAYIQARLKEEIPKLWQQIDSDFLQELVESMPRRIRACIKAGGYYTKY